MKVKAIFLPAATKLGQGNIFTSACLCTEGVSNFVGGLQFFGGSPIFWGVGGVSNFSGGSPIVQGGLQLFGGSPIFEGVTNFSGQGVSKFFFLFFKIFFPKISSGMHQPLPPRDGQCAAGTHPTGMHSCFF